MKFIIILLASLFGIAFAQQRRCPANMIQLFNGVACSTDAMCYNMAPGYFCLNGYCCANSASSPSGYGSSCTYQSQCSFANSQCLNNICYCASGYDYDGYSCQGGQTGNCAINQVLINGRCYSTSLPGGSCQYDQQCNDPLARKPLYCGNGICRWVFSGNPTCRTSSSAIERINGVIKNCLYQDCSFGYQCEYNQFFNNGQYICCSTSPSNGGGGNNGGNQPGQIKFYPGTSLPLECRAINACTFVDFPHCVYSQRYGYQVCCSTKNCY